MFLFLHLTRDIQGRPKDLDYIPLQLVSGCAIVPGSIIGMWYAIRSLTRTTARKGWAIFGLALNVGPWLLAFVRAAL